VWNQGRINANWALALKFFAIEKVLDFSEKWAIIFSDNGRFSKKK